MNNQRAMQIGAGVLSLILLSSSWVTAQRTASAQPAPIDGILVKNGILVLAGRDTVQASIVLERTASWLRVVEIAAQTTRVTTDTVDASGLYVHTATPVPRSGSIVNSPGVYVLRRGRSSGDPAVGVVGRTVRPGWRPIAATENYPAGAIDPGVGCYRIERGEWDDPVGAARLSTVTVPDDIRLHWQHLWHWGAEFDLVATDAHGRVLGPRTTAHIWSRVGADSVQVVFGTGFESAVFRLSRAAEDLVGTVTKYGDERPGPEPKATVRLRRFTCPVL